MNGQTLQQVNAHLMQTLHFTPEDLAANRAGRMTDAQRERVSLVVAQGTRAGLAVVILVIVVVVGVCAYILLTNTGQPDPSGGLIENNPLLVVGVIAVIMVFYLAMVLYSFSRARRTGTGAGKVRAITGKVRVTAQGMTSYSAASVVGRAAGAPTTSTIVQVGRETIYSTDAAVSRAFQEGGSYRVYVLGGKRAYMILSAEAVSGA